MTAQEIITNWITANPRTDGENDDEWRQRCRAEHREMPRSTFSSGWYAATGLPRPEKPQTVKSTNKQVTERRTEKMTLVMTPSVARKLRIMCAVEGIKPSVWIERAIMAAPDPKI